MQSKLDQECPLDQDGRAVIEILAKELGKAKAAEIFEVSETSLRYYLEGKVTVGPRVCAVLYAVLKQITGISPDQMARYIQMTPIQRSKDRFGPFVIRRRKV